MAAGEELEQRFHYGLDELARQLRPERELGVAAVGFRGASAGVDPAASA